MAIKILILCLHRFLTSLVGRILELSHKKQRSIDSTKEVNKIKNRIDCVSVLLEGMERGP